jgi:hypothetical protein
MAPLSRVEVGRFVGIFVALLAFSSWGLMCEVHGEWCVERSSASGPGWMLAWLHAKMRSNNIDINYSS